MSMTSRRQRADCEAAVILALEQANGHLVSTRYCLGVARRLGVLSTIYQINGACWRLWQKGVIARCTQGRYRFLWQLREIGK
jgi:hypothetical protein